MDTMSEFVASAVEFIVGGMLFTLAVLSLLLSGATFHPVDSQLVDLLSASTTLVAAVFVAISYVMGVVAESLARSMFEGLLDRVTVRTEAFRDPHGHPSSEITVATHRRGALRTRLIQFVLGDGFTTADRDAARAERERQRAVVMTFHVTLHSEVQGQLKRLRMERVFALSLLVTVASLVIRHEWGWAMTSGAALILSVWLVKGRLDRYAAAIARGHQRVEDDQLVQTSQQLNTSGALAGEQAHQ